MEIGVLKNHTTHTASYKCMNEQFCFIKDRKKLSLLLINTIKYFQNPGISYNIYT